MPHHLVAQSKSQTKSTSTPIHIVGKSEFKAWLGTQPKHIGKWVKDNGFEAKSGKVCLLPGRAGALVGVLVGTNGSHGPDPWTALPARLPKGRYRIAGKLGPEDAEAIALGWGLGTYEFARYRKNRSTPASLVWPTACDRRRVTRLVDGTFLARDLINTPASDMGPAELAAAAITLGKKHSARTTVIKGKQLLEKNFPTIHAVGRGSSREPRLVDMRWGSRTAPKLTLVGKGVCFDSGGLDLKSPGNMKLMKKDMGGAATVLGLAHAIMDARLPVRLRVLIPAVENSVSGDAYRPLDVIRTRKGLTVEVGNTDAEGRLVLCDALDAADSEDPDLIIDLATLTGAARVALGTELPALFSNNDAVADAILDAGTKHHDPMWRLPLHDAYRRSLDSSVADINNISNSPYGGAITAALFLREFVRPRTSWVHIDTMAWRTDRRAGQPIGGEGFGIRALYAMLVQRYGGKQK